MSEYDMPENVRKIDSSTESNYLTDKNDDFELLSPGYKSRRDIWRKTILLFHKYKQLSGGFQGPFFEAGYTKYIIEPRYYPRLNNDRSDINTESENDIAETSGKEHQCYNPDIVAYNNDKSKVLIIDITYNPTNSSQKASQIFKYRSTVDKYSFSSFGFTVKNGYDFIISHPEFYS